MRTKSRLALTTLVVASMLGLVAPASSSAQDPQPLICSSYKILSILIYTCQGPPGPQGPAGPTGPQGPAGTLNPPQIVSACASFNAASGCQIPPSDIAVVTVQCPAGTVMTGGGFEGDVFVVSPNGTVFVIPFDVGVLSSKPVANGWQASANIRDSNSFERLTVYAVCSPSA